MGARGRCSRSGPGERVAILWPWGRLPGAYQLVPLSIDPAVLRQVFEMRLMNTMGLVPSLFLMWLQIAVLAAIGVALSFMISLWPLAPLLRLPAPPHKVSEFCGPRIASGNMARPQDTEHIFEPPVIRARH